MTRWDNKTKRRPNNKTKRRPNKTKRRHNKTKRRPNKTKRRPNNKTKYTIKTHKLTIKRERNRKKNYRGGGGLIAKGGWMAANHALKKALVVLENEGKVILDQCLKDQGMDDLLTLQDKIKKLHHITHLNPRDISKELLAMKDSLIKLRTFNKSTLSNCFTSEMRSRLVSKISQPLDKLKKKFTPSKSIDLVHEFGDKIPKPEFLKRYTRKNELNKEIKALQSGIYD